MKRSSHNSRRVHSNDIDGTQFCHRNKLDKKKRKKQRSSRKQPSFLITYLQVSSVVLVFSTVVYYGYQFLPFQGERGIDDDRFIDDYVPQQKDTAMLRPNSQHNIHQVKNAGHTFEVESNHEVIEDIEESPIVFDTPLPKDPRAQYDAFGIASLFPSDVPSTQKIDLNPFLKLASEMREEFANRYGGENAARTLLLRGITTFDMHDVHHHDEHADYSDEHEHENEHQHEHKHKLEESDQIFADLFHEQKMCIPSHLLHTAKRILRALPNIDFQAKSTDNDDRDTTDGNDFRTKNISNHKFRIAFGGYSVTVGRGNYFHQSYPFVLKDLLQKIMKPMGLYPEQLNIRNAAIGGVSSFPYGWCMTNFWGGSDEISSEDQASSHNSKDVDNYADVVSWDYSMNEAGGESEGLEAYLRRVLQYRQTRCSNKKEKICKESPLLILKDTHLATQRKDMIQRYVEQGYFIDPLIIHTDPAVSQFFYDKTGKKLADKDLPYGFRDWRKFGSPPEAPGKAKHHPAVKEHELIGWILTMYFLSAIELLAYLFFLDNFEQEKHLDETSGHKNNFIMELINKEFIQHSSDKHELLPPPSTRLEKYNDSLIALFYGRPVPTSYKSSSIKYTDENSHNNHNHNWKMSPIHCATTFEPIVHSPLSNYITSGSTGENLHWKVVRGPMTYHEGWVLDWSSKERTAKRQLDRYGGMGFIDSKKAYYGIAASGVLKMFLPWRSSTRRNETEHIIDGTNAGQYFQSLVVCEVNENRGAGECIIAEDVTFTVGGAIAQDVKMIDNVGTKYLGKKICANVGIPKDAKVSKRSKADQMDRHIQFMNEIDSKSFVEKEEILGLELGIKVKNKKVTLKKGACSVSHVIWAELDYLI